MSVIAAVSTPWGNGGISVIRISGDGAAEIAEKLITPENGLSLKDFEANKMYLCKVDADLFSDRALCVKFIPPKSYTGEEVVEIHSHGGTEIARGILKKLYECGAEPAKPGEFSLRAFLNGKIDLANAEGIIKMINARSQAEVNAGYRLLKNEISVQTVKLQNELTDILAHAETLIDYPEEDIEEIDRLDEEIKECSDKLLRLAESSETGRIINNGINAVLCGRPNTGKSSLLNKLLNTERAIVTEIAGTTRDILEESFTVNGIRINLTDTAGLRNTEDTVEKIGVEKARAAVENADLVLFLLDAEEGATPEDENIYNQVKGRPVFVIINKTDKKEGKVPGFIETDKIFFLSALTGEGVAELKNAIYDYFVGSGLSGGEVILTEERHVNAVKKAASFLSNAVKDAEAPLDCKTVDIKSAWEALGEITGVTATEEIIDRIFEKFCLGK